jgi:hypothetical protein
MKKRQRRRAKSDNEKVVHHADIGNTMIPWRQNNFHRDKLGFGLVLTVESEDHGNTAISFA